MLRGIVSGAAAVTRLTGLTASEVQLRRDRGLVNLLPDDTGRSLARILWTNVFTVFNGIVGGCFVVLVVLGSWRDALFGFSVVANTVIGVVQEFQAKRTLGRLSVLNASRASVRRDGADVDCASIDVVLDDLLVLRPGEQMVGDATLLECHELEIDESLITGESEPIDGTIGRLLLSGSTIVAGSGLARVVRIGSHSYAAQITSEARRFSLVRSELRLAIGRIIRWLSVALLPIGAIVINGQMQAAGGWTAALSDGSWRRAAVTSVASVIAMVPAGLVLMTSVALALGAVRLARDRVLVRELAAVEGLARVDTLCIDKTGTLTEGAMALDRVEPVDQPPLGWQTALAAFAADPAENATTHAIGMKFPATISDELPDISVAFSSRHKWSGMHFTGPRSPGSWVLGGADIVLDSSATHPPAVRRATALAATGGRTLVLAHSSRPLAEVRQSRAPQLPADLIAVAVLVFREQVRADATETMRYFERQGVEVYVISGDDPLTVAAVARQVGLPVADESIDARALPTDPVELAKVLRANRVFGRVTPEQKKTMVIALKSLGHTVAMIGDGVNDTLALKHADLGIAMGSGSAAARAVAHVVILDSALSRLPGVVAEGRQVIANVERLAKLFLTKTVYAIALAIAFGLLLWPFPFLPRQLSVIDGLTIGLPALVLATIPNSTIHQPGFLNRAARFCLPSGLIVAGTIVAMVSYATAAHASATQVSTVAVIILTLCGLWVLVILARPLTRLTAIVVGGAYMGLIGMILIPFSTDFLQLELPPPSLLVVTVIASLTAMAALELSCRAGSRSKAERTADSMH
jgi:cation-transporting ATPase E